MALTAAELTALKTDILGNTDPVVVAALAGGNNTAIAAWYNLDASPDYFIFRSDVEHEEVTDAIDLQDLANITTADSDRVIKMLKVREGRLFDGRDARTRSAWDDVFSAAAGDNSQQAIAALWTRLATNAEKVFSLGTGTGADAANADTVSSEGDISSSDVRDALAS